jgi:GH24 family phage-related lysozyme (muramidase)
MINKTEATEDIKPKEDTVQAIEVKEPLEVKEIANIDDVPERAFKLITKYEGFHDKPYWDYKQWSCGYGMRCSKDTKNITKEKSKQFVMERIDLIRTKHKLHNIDDSIEVALISFTYNI